MILPASARSYDASVTPVNPSASIATSSASQWVPQSASTLTRADYNVPAEITEAGFTVPINPLGGTDVNEARIIA